MVAFYPLTEIETLRRPEPLFSSEDALRNQSVGAEGELLLWLPAAAGTALDIELNVTWPAATGAVVPLDFGSIGVKVLAAAPGLPNAGSPEDLVPPPPPLPPLPPPPPPPPRDLFVPPTQAAAFGPHHGPGVTLAASSATGKGGATAVWGGQPIGGRSTGVACNEVALLTAASNRSFWLELGPRAAPWTDIGWCAASLDATGASWVGPAPPWIGFQAKGKAWVYRSTGLFKASSSSSWHDQGVPFGAAFGGGANVTAVRHPPRPESDSNGAGAWRLEFLVDGRSQGNVSVGSDEMPADIVGCVAACGGGTVATVGGEHWPPPAPPAPPPTPAPSGGGAGAELMLSSGPGGEIQAFGESVLVPAGRLPRPHTLMLRVLVDRSLIEAFAQRGRRSVALPIYSEANHTALVWRPPAAAGGHQVVAVDRPTVSMTVWAMRTGYFE
jgi:hypothetical protein